MAVSVTTLQDLKSLECVRRESTAEPRAGQATAGECAFGGNARALNGEVISCNARESGVLDGVLL